jgi:hypothetical protein
MKTLSGKSCRGKQNTHLIFTKLVSESSAVYEIIWKKYGRARQATDGNIIWRMRIAYWISKATDTHS